jgi:MoxR-like ATPase
MALLRGRDYVLPQDVLDVAGDVLAHRLVLSYDAIADGVPAAHAVRRLLQTVPLPQVAPRQRANGPVEMAVPGQPLPGQQGHQAQPGQPVPQQTQAVPQNPPLVYGSAAPPQQ